VLHATTPLGQQLIHLAQGGLSGLAILRLDYDDQIVRFCSFGFGCQQAGLSQDLFVCLGSHDDACIKNARETSQGAL